MNIRFRSISFTAIAGFALLLSANASAQWAGRGRIVQQNSSGGITTHAAQAGAGYNRGYNRRHETITDGTGNATRNGSSYAGNAFGGYSQSSGSSYINGNDAGYSRQRNGQTAQGGTFNGNSTWQNGQGFTHQGTATAADGKTYSGQTSITKDGVTRSGTCHDASGSVVSC